MELKNNRIWLISDTHIGCRSNSVLWLKIIEDYFYEFFIPLVKREYKEGDVLFHLGDVFDNRQSLNLAAQDLGIRVFEELSKIFPEIHIIVGNHDIMRKNSNDISSVDCLKYIPNVNVHKQPKVLQYNGIKCLLMPWRRDSLHERETLDSFKNKIDFLFCHTETQGVQTSSNPRSLYEGGNSLSTFDRFHRVYSGHIHYRQERENFVLVGNPYQMTRSDRGNEKGIYILDLNTNEHTFIKNDKSPIFIKYKINDILEKRISYVIEKIKNNFVDIYIPSTYLGKYNVNSLIDHLDGYANHLEPKIYDEESQSGDLDEISFEFKGNYDLLKLSKDYIEGLNYDMELKSKLTAAVVELYKEASINNEIIV